MSEMKFVRVTYSYDGDGPIKIFYFTLEHLESLMYKCTFPSYNAILFKFS